MFIIINKPIDLPSNIKVFGYFTYFIDNESIDEVSKYYSANEINNRLAEGDIEFTTNRRDNYSGIIKSNNIDILSFLTDIERPKQEIWD